MSTSHKKDDVLIVIRNAGERTTECCKTICESLVGPQNVKVIREAPFERALSKMCDVAINHGATWTFSVDADVLLHADAVSYLWQTATSSKPDVFQVQAPVVCKLFRGVRFGMRMYRTSVLSQFRDLIPQIGTTPRPESFVVNTMRDAGQGTILLTEPVGIHDFEQYYRDIYRTAYVFGQKFVKRLPELLPAWKALKSEDADFAIALRGVYDGLLGNDNVVLDPAFYLDSSKAAIIELELEEKRDLLPAHYSAHDISEIIDNTHWPNVDKKLIALINQKPHRTVWNRLQRIPVKLAQSRTIRRYLGLRTEARDTRRPQAA